ncbi:MAG TPA: nucleotidyl transferase AbiEii/AbiGii toxin family protein [Flammeovirgaceae bacterium]|nr:nucleotidyl transferase AbiEii/AbiGii toxin family protein [Flammeovirgaceae bacterium]
MIAKPYIADWQKYAPWRDYSQIEQDLLISRTLAAIYADDFLHQHLAFRGGTALYKLYLLPAPRYSEDIDLVQIKPGPIKPIVQRIDEIITFFEEKRSTQNRGNGIRILYRFTAEYEGIRMRLKLEINCREHFNLLGWANLPFMLRSKWHQESCYIRTYDLNELLGTKLRALYQRSKGRDLFDLDYARRHADLDLDKIVYCYKHYIELSTKGKPPSQKVFLQNIENKINSPVFLGDLHALLKPEIHFNPQEAFEWLKEEIISRL